MCGIAGVVRPQPSGTDAGMLARMAAAVRHRGPDGFGVYVGERVGLAHVRLSIIDLETGAQPLGNEDGSVIVVYNGEIFNYIELTHELRARGHVFRTTSDTEVLVRGYEEWGDDLVDHLNGDFAFALYDRRRQRVLLARDRFGVRPLFYAETPSGVYFASEVKALFASGAVQPVPDPEGLDQVFTFWSALPPRTVFRGVRALEPGTLAIVADGAVRVRRYYRLDCRPEGGEPDDVLERLDALLRSSVSQRLRADVPVGGYLSGGLDSSVCCLLAMQTSPYPLRTFSIAFEEPSLDESGPQRLVAEALHTLHSVQRTRTSDVGMEFPEVLRHTETPLVRTAPVPMYLLAGLTRRQGIKVVLTGEGSDELFLGYDLFKEVALRLFCLRQPGSRVRPRLFDRLYPYLEGGPRAGDFWRRFFLSAGGPEDPLFSHLPRFLLTRRIREFYAPEWQRQLGDYDPLVELREGLPAEFRDWTPLGRAAYLEMVTLLGPYLLGSQGDRVAMAHAVEGRFPFLDHRLFEFAARLPEASKLRGLRDKRVLRRWAAGRLPAAVADRPKQPYRAPDAAGFFGATEPGYVREALGTDRVEAVGCFVPAAVDRLLERCRTGRVTGFRENQAMVAILSTQLWHETFMGNRAQPRPINLAEADVRWIEGVPAPAAPGGAV